MSGFGDDFGYDFGGSTTVVNPGEMLGGYGRHYGLYYGTGGFFVGTDPEPDPDPEPEEPPQPDEPPFIPIRGTFDLELVVEVLRAGRTFSLARLVGAGVEIGGGLRIDSSALRRRTLNLSIVDETLALVPDQIGDLLAAPSRLRVSLRTGNGPLTLLGTFGISRTQIDDSHDDLAIRVDAYDLTARISRNRWRQPYQIADGMELGAALRAAISDRFPGARFNFVTTGTSLSPVTWGLEPDHDPWADWVQLASEHGYQLFLDANTIFVLRRSPDAATTTSTHTYIEGEASCTMTAVSRQFDDDRGFNWVVGTAEGPHLAVPLQAERWDSDPMSRTYTGVLPDGTPDPALPEGSDWGIVPRFFTSGILSTLAELEQACDTYLANELYSEEAVTISALPDPTQDVDEVITAVRERAHLAGRFQVTSVNLPFTGEAMTIDAFARRPL